MAPKEINNAPGSTTSEHVDTSKKTEQATQALDTPLPEKRTLPLNTTDTPPGQGQGDDEVDINTAEQGKEEEEAHIDTLTIATTLSDTALPEALSETDTTPEELPTAIPEEQHLEREEFELYRFLLNALISGSMTKLAKTLHQRVIWIHNTTEKDQTDAAIREGLSSTDSISSESSPQTSDDEEDLPAGSVSPSHQTPEARSIEFFNLCEELKETSNHLNKLSTALLNDYQNNDERASNKQTEKKLVRTQQTTANIIALIESLNNIEKEIKKSENEKHEESLANLEEKKAELLGKLKLDLKINEENKKLQYLKKIGGELLVYDRARLLERLLFKPWEALLAYGSLGILTLAKIPALAESLGASGFLIFEQVATVMKEVTFWVMTFGLACMFLDALNHVLSPLFPKHVATNKVDENGKPTVRLETIGEWWTRITNGPHIRKHLKAKLLERARWMPLLFTSLIITSIVVTKVLLKGNFFWTYVANMVAKMVYASVACGMLGFKWIRFNNFVKRLEKEKNKKTEATPEKEKIHLPTIANIGEEEKTQKTQKAKPGKVHWLLPVPPIAIGIAICWIIRKARGDNSHDFLVAQTKPEDRTATDPISLAKIERRNIAEGFRQKIFCLSIKLSLLAGLLTTTLINSPLISAILFFSYGLLHAAYEMTRCFTKKTKWRKLKRELHQVKDGIASTAVSIFSCKKSTDDIPTAQLAQESQPLTAMIA